MGHTVDSLFLRISAYMCSKYFSKLLWFVLFSATGKTITGKILAKDHGFVFYEGDSFCTGVNPFEDPSKPNLLPTMYQKPLRVCALSRYEPIMAQSFYNDPE